MAGDQESSIARDQHLGNPVRERVSKRLWQRLASLANLEQKKQLENLLLVPMGKRYSKLDELKKGPTRISSSGLVQALQRYKFIRDLGIGQINFGHTKNQNQSLGQICNHLMGTIHY